MQDPIADMLTRIRNAQQAKHESIELGHSKLKFEIARVLKDEGYIKNFEEAVVEGKKKIKITLKYYQGNPVIERINRISKPGRRVYFSKDQIKSIPGFGMQILTTSKGLMSHSNAKSQGIGGEVICEIA